MKITKKKQIIKKAKLSKMTLDKLAIITRQGFLVQDKKTDKKIEDLAIMIQKSNFITKNDLREELKNFITKDDLRKEFANFKVEIKEYLLSGIDDLLTRADKVLSRFGRSNQEEIAYN